MVAKKAEGASQTATKARAKPPATIANTASNPAAMKPAGAKPAGEDKPVKSKWSWMRIEQLEEKIAFLEGRIAEIDRALDDPDIWTEIDRANALTTERDELKTELEGVEAEWLRKAE